MCSRVLRASERYTYQLALLAKELRRIFAYAPAGGHQGDEDGGRRRDRDLTSGDCPICLGELGTRRRDWGEEIVWCQAACGQNMHEECFEMWSVMKRKQEGGGGGAGSEVTCPLCTSVWQGDEDLVRKIKRKGKKVGAEGDVNVADQLDGSSERDSSPERGEFALPSTYIWLYCLWLTHWANRYDLVFPVLVYA